MIKQKLFFLAGPGVLLLGMTPFLPSERPPTESLPTVVGEWLGDIDGKFEKYRTQRQDREEFLAVLDATVHDMHHAGLSLGDATDGMIEYCADRYPFYLSILRYVEEGDSHRERVANNLVRQYVCTFTPDPDEAFEKLVEQWEEEFRTIRVGD